MTEQERDLIRDAMMFAVKDMTGRVMREATVQSMIDDFKKTINYTHSCIDDSKQLVLFANWLQFNSIYSSPKQQVKDFLKEQQKQE